MIPVEARRWAPMAFFFAAGLLLLGARAWRVQAPGGPIIPMARIALDFDEEWTSGRRMLAAGAPTGLPPFARWRADVAPGEVRLVTDVPLPAVELPWVGGGPASIEGVPVAVSGYRSAAGRALLVIGPSDAPALLGTHAGPFQSEWSRFEYEDAARNRRLLLWRRGPRLFVLVTDIVSERASAWVPAPREAGPAPGSVVPTSPH